MVKLGFTRLPTPSESIADTSSPGGLDIVVQAPEYSNIAEMKSYQNDGTDRKPEDLARMIDLTLHNGEQVTGTGHPPTPSTTSGIYVAERSYGRAGGYGALWAKHGPSIQTITREARAAQLRGLPARPRYRLSP